MSAFVSVVHHMMYDKMIKREERMNALLSLLSEEEEEQVRKIMDELGTLERGALEEIIDHSDIHGWLSRRTALSERRLAACVRELRKRADDEEILKKSKDPGRQLDFTGNPSTALATMSRELLDGMPCDRALAILENEPERVRFQVANDAHEGAFGPDTDFYWTLRGAFMTGLLEKTPYTWNHPEENVYEIR